MGNLNNFQKRDGSIWERAKSICIPSQWFPQWPGPNAFNNRQFVERPLKQDVDILGLREWANRHSMAASIDLESDRRG